MHTTPVTTRDLVKHERSTISAIKPSKPYPDFPLFPHANGQWAKKIRGKIHYFGLWENPQAAASKYLLDRDDLQAGRIRRASLAAESKGNTLRDLSNRFLNSKKLLLDNNELSQITFTEYFDICDRLIVAFGPDRLLTDLRTEDFEQLRAKLTIGATGASIGMTKLGNLIRRVRSVFKFAYDADMIDRPIKFGPSFKGPSKKLLRANRNNRPLRMYESVELRSLWPVFCLEAASERLRKFEAALDTELELPSLKTRGTTITPDMQVLAMDSTIPFCEAG